MRVFKFGGASVKDADGVKNLSRILTSSNDEPLVVVISAMGKTTNALEKVAASYFNNDGNASADLKEVKDFHLQIISDLNFKSPDEIKKELNAVFVEMEWAMEEETARSKG